MGKEVDGQLSLFDSADDLLNELIKKPAKAEAATEEPSTEELATEEPVIKKTSKKSKSDYKEGDKVKNIYTETIFTVLADRGNELLVRGSDNSSHEMLKADVEAIEGTK